MGTTYQAHFRQKLTFDVTFEIIAMKFISRITVAIDITKYPYEKYKSKCIIEK